MRCSIDEWLMTQARVWALDGGGGGGGGSQKAQNNQKKQRGLLTKTLQQYQKLGPKVEVVLKIKWLIILRLISSNS